MSWVRRLPVPYPVILAAAGIAIGLVPGLPRVHLSAAVLQFFFVPPLVFEAALTFDQGQARSVGLPIALLATAGVGMTVLAIGAGAHYRLGFGWAADPIAVVAVIRQVGAPPRLARGPLSIALALAVSDPRGSTVAYGMVVLSLLLQGGLLRPFAKAVEASEPE